jgi:hypothetical protein
MLWIDAIDEFPFLLDHPTAPDNLSTLFQGITGLLNSNLLQHA